MRCAGASSVRPSHQTSPSSVSATFVKITSWDSELSAVGLVVVEVPGATPKKPASGLIAYRRPSAPLRIQAMSSPTVSTFMPGIVGRSMARFVLPQALGNAALRWNTWPLASVSLRMSMCSASQPSSWASTDAMRRA